MSKLISNTAYVQLPTTLKENEAYKRFIDFLTGNKNTPLDIACKHSLISISLEMYSAVCYLADYEGTWTATSIYKEYWNTYNDYDVTEVHYFDHWGVEHRHSGFDYYENGHWHSGTFHPLKSQIKGSSDFFSRPWRPQEVTVTKTETISNVRETGRNTTSGTVKGRTEIQFGKTVQKKEQGLADWIYNSIKASYKLGKKVEADTIDKQFTEVTTDLSDSELENIISNAKTVAHEQGERDVPGQQHINYRIVCEVNISKKIVLFPTYHIRYEYAGKNYDVYISASDKNCLYAKEVPVSKEPLANTNELQSSINMLNDTLKQNKKKYGKIIGIYLLIQVGRWILYFVFYAIISMISNYYNDMYWANAVVIILLLIVKVISFIIALRAFIATSKNSKWVKMRIGQIQNEIAQAEENAVKTKAALGSVMKDQSLSNTDKKGKCLRILNDYLGKLVAENTLPATTKVSFCTMCGVSVSDTDVYCSECGYKLR